MNKIPAELIEIQYYGSERISLKVSEKPFSEMKTKGFKLEQCINDTYIFVKPATVIAVLRSKLGNQDIIYSFDFKEEIKSYFKSSRISRYKAYEYLKCAQEGYIEFEIFTDRKAYISIVHNFQSLYVNN